MKPEPVGCLFCSAIIVGGTAPLKRQIRNAMHPASVEISDIEMVCTTSEIRYARSWASVARVDERDGFWFARNAYGDALFAFPQECMAPEQIAEFRLFLAGPAPVPQA